VSAIERRPVRVRGRWAIVTIDEHAVQCTVPAYGGGRYAVSGYGTTSIDQAAEYGRQHGTTYRTRADAERAITGEQS